jgi:DNA-binding Lrp family transcriptional regulator
VSKLRKSTFFNRPRDGVGRCYPLNTETVGIADAFKSVRKIAKQLDPVNIKILWTMSRLGPRNLLKTARRAGMPFSSVYRRIEGMEAKSGRVAYLIPQLSRIGMTRVVVLIAAKTGYEEEVRMALKIPNLWRSVNSCEGHFTYHSVHAVPVKYLREFTAYMRRLSKLGFVTRMKLIRTGEQYPNFPDFEYYNSKKNEWTLPWGKWLSQLRKIAPSKEELDPRDYPTLADKRDLIIVKELEKNARKSFADIAAVLGISLQAVKQRYDNKLVRNGIVKNYAFEVYAYPVEVSAYHEIMLEFASELALRRFIAIRSKLFFLLGSSKVINQNILMIRTCILESQVVNLFKFFSEMGKARMLKSYSAVRMSFVNRETQSISYELFDDFKGWAFDLRHSLNELQKVTKQRNVVASRTAKHRTI